MNGTTKQDGTEQNTEVVYTTATGEEPRGGVTRTQEATELPPPVKRIAKKTTKKHKPRVRAKAEPLHTHIKWDPEHWAQVQAAARPGEAWVIISDTEARTVYTS